MTATLERILAEVGALSSAEKAELRLILEKEQPPVQPRNEALIRELCGKYRDVLGSTEEFMARKQEEIDLEERRFRQG